MPHGLFIGLITLDLIYLTETIPQPNQKLVALDALTSAGGPATNASVTFSHLGNESTLLTALGKHPMTALIHSDLDSDNAQPTVQTHHHAKIIDLVPQRLEPPPTSSILVTQGTGDRAIISINATQTQARPDQIPADILNDINIVLIDGHQIEVSRVIAQQAQAQNIPVVLDGGSWKPGLEEVLPWVDYAICSANFRPPGCQTLDQAIAYLMHSQVPHWAFTQGAQPIRYGYQIDGTYPTGDISIPPTPVIDTLGAGDIFHGAFCHAILQQSFPSALATAAPIASRACQFFGTRRWMVG